MESTSYVFSLRMVVFYLVIILWTQGYYHRGTRLNTMCCRDSFFFTAYETVYCIVSVCCTIIVYYYIVSVCFCFFLCPCMAINVSVQYNGGLLHGIILLTQQCYYHRGTHLNAMKRFCICSL